MKTIKKLKEIAHENAQKSKDYFFEEIWKEESDTLNFFNKLLRYKLRLFMIVFDGLLKNDCVLRARALTYTALFSLVPLLAFAFSVLKGLGLVEEGVGHIRPVLEPFIAFDKKEEILSKFVEFIENINAGAIGGVGLILLAYAVLSLLTTIEISFNKIWGIHAHRPLLQRITLYWTVVTLSPVLIVISIGLSTSAQFQYIMNLFDTIPIFSGLIKLLVFFMIPLVSIWVAFTFLYYVIPNTRVKIGAAFIGGVVAGTIYKIAEIGYIKYTAFVANFGTVGKIYGTIIAIPLFVFWIYIVWVIVLLGVEVSFAVQNMKNYMKERKISNLSYTENEKITFCVFLEILKRFYYNEPPMSNEDISDVLHLPIRLVNDILHFLEKNNIVSRTSDEPVCYVPVLLPENLKVFDFISMMRDRGDTSFIRQNDDSGALVSRLYDNMNKLIMDSLGSLTFHDYMKQLNAPITTQTKPRLRNLFQFWKKSQWLSDIFDE